MGTWIAQGIVFEGKKGECEKRKQAADRPQTKIVEEKVLGVTRKVLEQAKQEYALYFHDL